VEFINTFGSTLGTPIYIASVVNVAEDFNLSTTLAIAPGSFYPFGLAIGALLGTATCEIYGRSIVYRSSLPVALLFTIMGGSSKNYTTLAFARSLAGLFSGPCLTVGVGILNDLWDLSLEKIGTLFAVFFVVMMIWATELGPMVSAAILVLRTWRWTFWVASILLGITAVVSFFVPETYRPQILHARAQKSGLKVPTRGDSLKLFLVSVGRPLHMILVEPVSIPWA
jgi:MFS family permease